MHLCFNFCQVADLEVHASSEHLYVLTGLILNKMNILVILTCVEEVAIQLTGFRIAIVKKLFT